MKEKRKLSPLKVDQRIKFVGWAAHYDNGALKGFFADSHEPMKATILALIDGGEDLRVTFDCGQVGVISRRQVVKVLKPKKAPAAPERVERFAIEWAKSGISSVVHKTKDGAWAAIGVEAKERVIHLVELRQNEKILSEMEVVNAWGNIGRTGGNGLAELLRFLGFREEREP